MEEKLQKILAVTFNAITGCRPKEAAWVAVFGKPKKNYVKYEGFIHPYKIVMPSREIKTKTGRPYTWLIEKKYEYFAKALALAKKPLSFKLMQNRLHYAF